MTTQEIAGGKEIKCKMKSTCRMLFFAFQAFIERFHMRRIEWLHVWLHELVNLCLYVCMDLCMYVRMSDWVNECIYEWMSLYMHTFTLLAFTCTHWTNVQSCIHTYLPKRHLSMSKRGCCIMEMQGGQDWMTWGIFISPGDPEDIGELTAHTAQIASTAHTN